MGPHSRTVVSVDEVWSVRQPFIAYREAYNAAFGTQVADSFLLGVLGQGVPRELLAPLGCLSAASAVRWEGSTGSVVRDFLVTSAGMWARTGHLRQEQVLVWVAALAGFPSYQRAWAARDLLIEREPITAGLGPWLHLPAAAAAAGWAAGLTPAQTEGMPVADLHAWAALRGWAQMCTQAGTR